MITSDAIHIVSRGGDAAKDIAAAEHETDLNFLSGDFGDFLSERKNAVGIKTERESPGKSLPRDFQKDAFEG
jgi:hypothetical protein